MLKETRFQRSVEAYEMNSLKTILQRVVKTSEQRFCTWESLSEYVWMASGRQCSYWCCCAISTALPCSPVSIHSEILLLCFLQAAQLSLAVRGPGQTAAGFSQMHIKGSPKQEKKQRSCPANCFKDALRRGVERLIWLGLLQVPCHQDDPPEFMCSTTTWEQNHCSPLLCPDSEGKALLPHPLTPGSISFTE